MNAEVVGNKKLVGYMGNLQQTWSISAIFGGK
jgi:hypothetical protein